jgi:hypothetical protein
VIGYEVFIALKGLHSKINFAVLLENGKKKLLLRVVLLPFAR